MTDRRHHHRLPACPHRRSLSHARPWRPDRGRRRRQGLPPRKNRTALCSLRSCAHRFWRRHLRAGRMGHRPRASARPVPRHRDDPHGGRIFLRIVGTPPAVYDTDSRIRADGIPSLDRRTHPHARLRRHRELRRVGPWHGRRRIRDAPLRLPARAEHRHPPIRRDRRCHRVVRMRAVSLGEHPHRVFPIKHREKFAFPKKLCIIAGVRIKPYAVFFITLSPHPYGDPGRKYSKHSSRSIENHLKETLKSVHFGGIDRSCGNFINPMIHRLGFI